LIGSDDTDEVIFREEYVYDIVMDSFLYFVDCCKRNTVQNYCYKTWLTHLEFKAKDFWKQDIAPRYAVILPHELLEEINI